MIDQVPADGLAAFRHRKDYAETTTTRDRWTVRAVNAWILSVLPPLLESGTAPGPVLDVGCGEQPFRPLVEASGRRYVGMDVVQNSAHSVDLLTTLEDAASPLEPFAAVLCTEVLEHVVDIDAAFSGLRRVIAPGGVAVLTIPFIFPLHMEPYDFRRLTLHGAEELAARYRFRVEHAARLGGLAEVLAMIVADASILPVPGSLYSKLKVGALRAAAGTLVRLLDSGALSRRVIVNSNTYLSNGVVLRAM